MLNQQKNTVMRVVAGPGKGSEFALGKGRHVVGSGSGCALRIDHASVAALHAMIVVGDDVLRVYPVQRSVQLGAIRDPAATTSNSADNSADNDRAATHAPLRTVEVNGTDFELNQQILIGQACVIVAESAERSAVAGQSPIQNPIESAIKDPSRVITKRALDITATADGSGHRGVRRHDDRSSASLNGDVTKGGDRADADDAVTTDDGATAEHPLVGPSLTLHPDDQVRAFPEIKSSLRRDSLAQENANAHLADALGAGDGSASANAIGRAARQTIDGIAASHVRADASRAAVGARRSNSRALVTVAQAGASSKPSEALGLVASGAADVASNIRLGFSALLREGFGISRPLVIASFLFLAIGFILVVDRQTVAVNDPTVSPVRALSTELHSRNFGELQIGENSNNKIELNGFVASNEDKRLLDELVRKTGENSTAVDNVVVASELVDDVGDVLNEFNMAGLERRYLGNGQLKIEGYVGPELNWDTVVSTLLSDFPSITKIDDSGVETLSVRLNDLKLMMLDGGIEKLSVKPKGSKIQVKGSLPAKDISKWGGVVNRFRAKYGDQPIVVDEVERVDPGEFPPVPVEGKVVTNGVKEIVIPFGQHYAEGDTLPDGVKLVRIAADHLVFDRDGYEYVQPFYPGSNYLDVDESN